MHHDSCHPRAHLRVGRILDSQDRITTNNNQLEYWRLLDALIGEKFPEHEDAGFRRANLDRHLKPLQHILYAGCRVAYSAQLIRILARLSLPQPSIIMIPGKQKPASPKRGVS